MGICLSKDATASNKTPAATGTDGNGAAAAAAAGAKAGGTPPQAADTTDDAESPTDHHTSYRLVDQLASVVDTVGESANRTFGLAFKSHNKDGGHGGIAQSDGLLTMKKLDDAFKTRVRAAREGMGQRLKVVFADPLNLTEGYEAPVHIKTEEDEQFINKCLGGAFLFEQIGEREKRTLVNAFEKYTVKGDETIIRQGDIGDYFYIIQRGKVKFVVDGKEVGKGGRGDIFGELALLYNSPRAATVVAMQGGDLWRVDQMTFRRIIATYKVKEDEETKKLLQKVEFMKDLDDAALTKIAYLMGTKKFDAGQELVAKGQMATEFILVKSGKLTGTDMEQGGKKCSDRQYGPGDHFGALAVLKGLDTKVTLTAVEDTTVLYLEKFTFIKMCGDYEELIRKGDDLRVLMSVMKDRKLDASTAGHLASVIENRVYKKGHVFYKEGDTVRAGLYSVRIGEVNVESAADGSKVVGPLGVFGEETIAVSEADGSGSSGGGLGLGMVVAKHTATVITDVQVGFLDVQSIQSVLGPTPSSSRTEDRGKVEMKDLERHRILGAGTFGQVWLVNRQGTRDAYALKIQFKRQLIDSNQAAGVIRENKIMSKLHSPFIIKLVASYQDTENVYMLMKLYQGGELWSVMHGGDGDALPEPAAKFYAASILEGLTYMHRRSVLYRDLKPENVLLESDGYTVIVDLGFAKVVPDKTYTFCGTPLYLSPEIILQRGHDKGADHWSWGVMLYEMLCGITPFYDKGIDQMALFKRIINQKYSFPRGDFISENAKDLIQSMLIADPNSRLGSFANAERDIQKHPWFRDFNFEKLQKKQLTPPWEPEITDPLDVSNFDNWDHLKDKKPEGKALTKKEQKVFQDFC